MASVAAVLVNLHPGLLCSLDHCFLGEQGDCLIVGAENVSGGNVSVRSPGHFSGLRLSGLAYKL